MVYPHETVKKETKEAPIVGLVESPPHVVAASGQAMIGQSNHMKRKSILLATAGAILVGIPTVPAEPHARPAASDVLDALQTSIAEASRKAAPSLVLVKIERGASQNEGQAQPPPGLIIMGGGSRGPTTAPGIFLTPEGHILVPGIFKADQDQRLLVYAGENEYVARSVKVDESLGMSILKVEAGEKFPPLDLSKASELSVGQWAVALTPTDEELDYQTIKTPLVCQGTKDGYYRQFRVGLIGGVSYALVADLSGQLVGFLERGGAVTSLKDLQADLGRMLADASGKSSAEEEKKKKGWLGTSLAPVNREWAKAIGITPGAVRITFVEKDSPADLAGLKAGDLITGVGGKPLRLTETRALDYFSKSLQPRAGEKFTITALRDGKSADYSGTFTSEPEPESLRADDIGVTVSSIKEADVFAMNLSTGQGVLVTDVAKGSPAANSGSLGQTLLVKNDVIVELAAQPVTDVDSFGKILESLRREQPPVVLVKYHRGLLTGFAGLNLTLGEKEKQNEQ